MNRRKFVRRVLVCGGLTVAGAAVVGFGNFSFNAEVAASEVGVMIHGRWMPNVELWYQDEGIRHRIVELDNRGVWFAPSDDPESDYLQRYSGASHGLIRRGNVYHLVRAA